MPAKPTAPWPHCLAALICKLLQLQSRCACNYAAEGCTLTEPMNVSCGPAGLIDADVNTPQPELGGREIRWHTAPEGSLLMQLCLLLPHPCRPHPPAARPALPLQWLPLLQTPASALPGSHEPPREPPWPPHAPQPASPSAHHLGEGQGAHRNHKVGGRDKRPMQSLLYYKCNLSRHSPMHIGLCGLIWATTESRPGQASLASVG